MTDAPTSSPPPSVLVALELPGQPSQQHRLYSGSIIGRMAGAALHIDDPRVSEAHAMVSLRGKGLQLLALRGSLGDGSRWLREVNLRPPKAGQAEQVVQLTEDIQLRVLECILPDEILALTGLGPDPIELTGAEASILDTPTRPLVAGYRPSALAWLWCSWGSWQIQVGDGTAAPLEVGQCWQIGQREVTVISRPVTDAQTTRTVSAAKLRPPLKLRVGAEQTLIEVPGRRPVRITGNAGQIIRAAAQLTWGKDASHWRVVAGQIWSANPTQENWYVNMRRLREKLVSVGIYKDLVRSDEGMVRLDAREGIDSVVFVEPTHSQTTT